MIGTLLRPNIHAALNHLPVALITLGVLIEFLAMLLWRKSTVRSAGRWMLVLGILFAVPTATTGLLALRQTVNPSAPQGEMWDAIASTSTWTDAQWETLREHVTYAAIATVLLLLGIVIWIGGSDNARRNMYLLGIVVLVSGAGLIGYSAFQGGEMVYRFATGVNLPQEIEEHAHESQLSVAPPTAAQSDDFTALELHLLLAGCAIAILAVAVGLSVRLSNVSLENRFAEEKAVAAGYRPAGKMGQDSNLLSIPVIYPGIFWILAVLLLVATAATGLWLFGVRGPADLITLVRNKQANDEWRPVLHVYYGASIVGLAFLLGIVVKLWPRRRLIMGILVTLLVLAVAWQAFTGILMLFDGHPGSVMRFNRPPANRPIRLMPAKVAPPTTQPAETSIPVPSTTHTMQTPAPTLSPRHEEPLD